MSYKTRKVNLEFVFPFMFVAIIKKLIFFLEFHGHLKKNKNVFSIYRRVRWTLHCTRMGSSLSIVFSPRPPSPSATSRAQKCSPSFSSFSPGSCRCFCTFSRSSTTADPAPSATRTQPTAASWWRVDPSSTGISPNCSTFFSHSAWWSPVTWPFYWK